MGKQWIALIPAYEPEDFLPALLKAVEEAGFEAVVVDDGSGAVYGDTFRLASGYATVLTHMTNQGKGQALKTGMRYIQEQFGEDCIVVTMDADGQHKVPDAVRVVKKSAALGRSLVIGSRAFTGKIPLRSRFGNGMTRFVYPLATGSRVTDTQTGLRAFHMDSLDYMLPIPGDRYEYEMTMLLQCPRDGIPIVEVPIETVYLNENKSSHFNALKDSARIYKDILKFCGSSLLSFLVDFLLFNLLAYLLRDRANGIVISNVIARVISATFNYVLNKRVVFQKKGDVGKTAVQYFALAVGILIANTAIVTLLYEHVVHVKWVAKLIAEVVLFVVNWCVQRFIIFKKTEEADGQ